MTAQLSLQLSTIVATADLVHPPSGLNHHDRQEDNERARRGRHVPGGDPALGPGRRLDRAPNRRVEVPRHKDLRLRGPVDGLPRLVRLALEHAGAPGAGAPVDAADRDVDGEFDPGADRGGRGRARQALGRRAQGRGLEAAGRARDGPEPPQRRGRRAREAGDPGRPVGRGGGRARGLLQRRHRGGGRPLHVQPLRGVLLGARLARGHALGHHVLRRALGPEPGRAPAQPLHARGRGRQLAPPPRLGRPRLDRGGRGPDPLAGVQVLPGRDPGRGRGEPHRGLGRQGPRAHAQHRRRLRQARALRDLDLQGRRLDLVGRRRVLGRPLPEGPDEAAEGVRRGHCRRRHHDAPPGDPPQIARRREDHADQPLDRPGLARAGARRGARGRGLGARHARPDV
mmetsp:Transcript_77042/g.221324  ORF Transcript_77042/g.221324 Transcript_77042/m.221324 type:complete len:398 (+) Transcript_77042:415-1608(+)